MQGDFSKDAAVEDSYNKTARRLLWRGWSQTSWQSRKTIDPHALEASPISLQTQQMTLNWIQ